MKVIQLENYLQEKDKHVAPVVHNEKTKIMQIQLKKGNGIPEHDANADVFIIVQSGKVEFDVAGERVELTPNQILHMEPLEKHSLQAIEDVVLLVIRVER